jgi:hypothetical protein
MNAVEIEAQGTRLISLGGNLHIDPRTITVMRAIRRSQAYRQGGREFFALLTIETLSGKVFRLPLTDFRGAIATRNALWNKVDGPHHKPGKPSRLKELPDQTAIDPRAITALNAIRNVVSRQNNNGEVYKGALELLTWGRQEWRIPCKLYENAEKFMHTLLLMANNRPNARRITNFDGTPMPGDPSWATESMIWS